MLPLCSGSHDEDCDDDYDQDKEEDDDDYDHDKEEDDDSSPADNSASTLKLAVHQELSLSDDLYLIYLYSNANANIKIRYMTKNKSTGHLPGDLVLLGVHAAHNPIHELKCVRFSSHSHSTLEVIQL